MVEIKKVNPRTEAIEKIEYYITSNNLEPNTKLPSEKTLAEMWNISRTTIRYAIDYLTTENILYKKTDIGTFVSNRKYTRNIIGVNNLTRSLRETSMQFSTEILSFRIIKADKRISNKINVKIGDDVYELIRLRSIQSIPCFIETLYLSYERCPDIDKYYTKKSSLNSIFQNIYNLQIIDGVEKISITYPSLLESKVLKIKSDSPLFFASGITYTEDKNPLEYYKIVFRSDQFIFSYLIEDEEFKKRRNI